MVDGGEPGVDSRDEGKHTGRNDLSPQWCPSGSNMLDNDSVMAKTVNGFKTKLERERAKKMGLFLDSCPLGLGAVTEFRSGRPASILQVTQP